MSLVNKAISSNEKSKVTPRHYVLFVLRAFLYATGPIGFMILMKEYKLDPRVAVSYFLTIGGMLAIVVGLLTKKEQARKFTQYSLGDYRVVLWLVGLTIVTPLNYLSYVYAMKFGTITETTVLARLSPLVFFFLSIQYLDERVNSSTRVILAYVLMIGGVLFFTSGNLSGADFTYMIAWFLGVCVALMQAFETLFMLKVPRHTILSRPMTLGVTMLVSGIVLLVTILSSAESNLVHAVSLPEFLILAYLGFGTIVLPHLIGITMTEETNQPGFIASNAYLVVIITAPLAFIMHNEQVAWFKLIFAASIIALGIWQLKKATTKADQ